MCRATRRPDELVRIACVGDRLEPGRSLPGRGAWVCAGSVGVESLCLGRLHEKALSRALRRTVTTGDREDLQRRLA